MKKDIELLMAIKELREEVRHLRETVATLLDIVMEMRYETEEEVAPLDAHKTNNKFSFYHG